MHKIYNKLGGWVNPFKKENLQQKSFSDNVEWSSRKLQKDDICWYRNRCKTRNKRTHSCILQLLTEEPENLKYSVK